jgi:hypothetical protein
LCGTLLHSRGVGSWNQSLLLFKISADIVNLFVYPILLPFFTCLKIVKVPVLSELHKFWSDHFSVGIYIFDNASSMSKVIGYGVFTRNIKQNLLDDKN